MESPKRGGITKVIPLCLGLLAVVIAGGCGASTASSPPTPASTVAAVATVPPSPTPTPTPRVGSAVTISGSGQQIKVRMTGGLFLKHVPFLGMFPVQLGATYDGLGSYLVLVLHFANTGTTRYTSQVANWAWLTVKKHAGGTRQIVAAGSDNADPNNLNATWSDMQGTDHTGQMVLAPGKSMKWAIAFPISKRIQQTTDPVSFTYQGPGNKKVTWLLTKP